MDIVYKNKNKDTYNMVAIGDVFSYSGALYMRTQEITSVDTEEVYNAVNLKFGGFAFFNDNDEVTKKDAQIIVS